MLSPSSRYAAFPFCSSICSTIEAIVLFPEALRPVIQTVTPFCPSNFSRSSRETWPACQVMFESLVVTGKCLPRRHDEYEGSRRRDVKREGAKMRSIQTTQQA